MSSFEELRDQWIHDHVPSATLSLHYVFEAAENRIAALEAELEDSVHRGWDGLLTILTDIYPASIFGGVDDDWQDETRDLGPRLVTLARHLDAERKRAEQAEAEVERLRSRRCETCSHVLQPHSYSGPYEICWLADSPCYDEVLPDDFACNRWTAREEAGDE